MSFFQAVECISEATTSNLVKCSETHLYTMVPEKTIE